MSTGRICETVTRPSIRSPTPGSDWNLSFVPLHSSPYATKHLGTRAGEFPVTERVAASLIRLPIFPDMTSGDVRDVVSAVHKVAVSDTFRQKTEG